LFACSWVLEDSLAGSQTQDSPDCNREGSVYTLALQE
jgi:hypothetical protein